MFLRIKKNSASLSVTIVRILFNLNFLDTWYVHWVIWNTTKRNYFLLILPVNNNYNSYTCLHSWYLHWCLVSNTHEHFLQRLQWNWWVSKNIRKAKHASCWSTWMSHDNHDGLYFDQSQQRLKICMNQAIYVIVNIYIYFT